MNQMIELVYILSGVVLPVFYGPQVIRLLKDRSNLASYSLSKSVIQLALRFPALVFGVLVVSSPAFVFCVALDLLGRVCECSAAILALSRQGNSTFEILSRMNPFAATHGTSAA